jgi:TetR/AcrR family transcriptional repressor of lmrAB and yxaGH operons
MARRSDTKQRLRRTAADLFRRHGYHGTGINRIVRESGAPAGSLYFHFPGGKAELASEAVAAAGREIGRGIESLLESSDDPAEAIGRVLDYLATDLRNSDFEHGCPVGTVALDAASTAEPVRLSCRAVFDEWAAIVATHLHAAGWSKHSAEADALVVVALIEGALLLARARRDTEPLEAVAQHVRRTLDRAPAHASDTDPKPTDGAPGVSGG